MPPIQCWNLNRRSQNGLSIRDRKGQDQVLLITLEEVVRFHLDGAVAVTWRPAIWAGLAFSRHPYTHPFVDAGRDGDINGDCASDVPLPSTFVARVTDQDACAVAGWAGSLHS